MTLECDAKFEEKLTCGLENDIRILTNFHQTTKFSKLRLSLDPFIQSRKCMSLNLRGKLCVMTMKNDEKFEIELTCYFETDMSNSTNFYLSTQKSQKFIL